MAGTLARCARSGAEAPGSCPELAAAARDGGDRLEASIVFHAAPTLQRIKPATMLRCFPAAGSDWRARCAGLARGLGVEIVNLRDPLEPLLLLVYHPASVAAALAPPEARALLREAGLPSPDDGLDALVGELRRRARDEAFPHEIGLLLGYPPGDVRAFICRGGRACRATCAWQAYGDVARARQSQRRYRRAKERAALYMTEGLSPSEAGRRLCPCA